MSTMVGPWTGAIKTNFWQLGIICSLLSCTLYCSLLLAAGAYCLQPSSARTPGGRPVSSQRSICRRPDSCNEKNTCYGWLIFEFQLVDIQRQCYGFSTVATSQQLPKSNSKCSCMLKPQKKIGESLVPFANWWFLVEAMLIYNFVDPHFLIRPNVDPHVGTSPKCGPTNLRFHCLLSFVGPHSWCYRNVGYTFSEI